MKRTIALDTKRVSDIYDELREIAERESMKLYRMAKNAKKHGLCEETVEAIRNEARELHMLAYPEMLLDPFKEWQYAFH